MRVLVRDPATATALAAAGAEVAVGDLDVPASLDAAIDGVEHRDTGQPGRPRPGTERRPSAAHAGVAHIVKATSKASADSPIARRRGQAEIEAGLAAAGIPHTLLAVQRLHAERPAAGPRHCRDKQLRLRGRQGPHRDGRRPRRRRGGRQIAASPAAHVGKTYWLTGPELLSNYDVAAVLSKLLGRTITYQELTFEENRDAMIRAGVPEPIAERTPRHSAWPPTATPLDHRRRPHSSAVPPAPSSSSRPTTPPHSPEARQRAVGAGRAGARSSTNHRK